MQRPAKLALANGMVFAGDGFGAEGEVFGEVVFNTSMTGYQEILTDPSYCGQIVTMTYPLIGNYGSNSEDVESSGLFLRGFVVRELCRYPSNFRSEWSLDEYLTRAGIIGLEGIDTRALVKRIRIHGAMTGVLSTTDLDDRSLVAKAQASPELAGQDLVQEVVPDSVRQWTDALDEFVRVPTTPGYSTAHQANAKGQAHFSATALSSEDANTRRKMSQTPACERLPIKKLPHVVAIDYGMKWNIARHLRQIGCRVSIVPGTATAEDVLQLEPDGIFLSNGPGDPRPVTYAIKTIQELLGKRPIFGICLGHQLLGLACGGEIFKLKFGHRGANQPVLNHETNRVEITTQNHGFALDAGSLPKSVEVTHINLNDQTVEGIRHRDYDAFGVQYHPEASAGPHDSHYLFGVFQDLVHAAC